MIRIDRFIFSEFLRPQSQKKGVHRLHFVRKDGKPVEPGDVEDLKRIIEENKPESDKILHMNTLKWEDTTINGGEIITTSKGALPRRGAIVVLKGGTEREALEYCKQIAERSKSK